MKKEEEKVQDKAEVKVEQKQTKAHKIWKDMKDKQLDLFSLPGQFVHLHVTPAYIEPDRLYVNIKTSAVLTALEAAIAPAYTLEMVDKFIIISEA